MAVVPRDGGESHRHHHHHHHRGGGRAGHRAGQGTPGRGRGCGGAERAGEEKHGGSGRRYYRGVRWRGGGRHNSHAVTENGWAEMMVLVWAHDAAAAAGGGGGGGSGFGLWGTQGEDGVDDDTTTRAGGRNGRVTAPRPRIRA